mmetsp:Transcript_10870/g.25550  ORF Transcript_10870/g.25550 Transcript_10870/m.25550 type:complete len:238 (-) Transcript_10870:248-961(-)
MITAAPPSSIPRVSRSPSTAHAKMGLSAVSVHMMREDSVLGRRRLPSYIRALAKGSRTTLLSTSGGMASAANPESWKLKRRNDEITKRPRIAEGSMSMSDFQRVMVRRAPLKIGTTRATASPDPKLAKFSPLLTMSVTPPQADVISAKNNGHGNPRLAGDAHTQEEPAKKRCPEGRSCQDQHHMGHGRHFHRDNEEHVGKARKRANHHAPWPQTHKAGRHVAHTIAHRQDASQGHGG